MAKTILISGAAGALGEVVVARAVSAGYRVHAIDKQPCTQAGAQTHVVDLTDETAVTAFLEALLAEEQRIDAAFLLAGGFAMGDVGTTDLALLDAQISLNFKTAYQLARPLFAHMCKERAGELCFIGARTALEPATGGFALAYTLSKNMLTAFVKMLALEGRPQGVRASLVVPSIIDTPANRVAMPDANTADWVSPDAIADALLLLLEPRSSGWQDLVLKLYHKA